MEILFISHKYPPAIGGMEKHAYELQSRLQSHFKIHQLVYDNQEGRFRFFYYLKKKKSFFAKCIFLLEQIKYKNRARWLAKYFKALSLRSKVPVQSLVRPSVVKIAANYIGSFV